MSDKKLSLPNNGGIVEVGDFLEHTGSDSHAYTKGNWYEVKDIRLNTCDVLVTIDENNRNVWTGLSEWKLHKTKKFEAMKMKVTTFNSEDVQKELIKQGFKWRQGGTHTTVYSGFLYTSDDGTMAQGFSLSEFESNCKREYLPKPIHKVEFELAPEKKVTVFGKTYTESELRTIIEKGTA